MKNKIKENLNKKTEKVSKAKQNVEAYKKQLANVTIVDIIFNIITSLLESFKYALNDIILMPGKQLQEPLQFSALITLLSCGCKVLKLPFLIDWRGALISTVVLAIIVLIAKRKE